MSSDRIDAENKVSGNQANISARIRPSYSDKLTPCESERSQPLVSSFYFGVAETV